MNTANNLELEEMIDALQGRLKTYLKRLPDRPVNSQLSISDLREALPDEMDDTGVNALEVALQLADLGEKGTVATAGPRYFGFVTGGVLPAALGVELLGVTWDQNAAMAVMSPIAAVTEEIAERWLLEVLQLPADSSVGFVTGGQGANTTCLAIACHHLLTDLGWDLNTQGLFGAPPVQVLVGAERHTTIDVSLRSLGLGAPALLVGADAQGRMRPSQLETALAQVSGPTIVCAQAGNVNSGAFDPLDEIAQLCKARGAWLHVDGAFGLWAAASPTHQHLVRGIQRADSWSTDGHKWLNVPYDCGYAITAHPQSHRAAFGSTASYYVLGGVEAPRDGMDFVPEASRRARGLATWAALRSLGRRGVAELVERCCELARLMAERLGAEPDIDILNDVVLNQVLVRFGGSDQHTRAVIEAVQREGTCWAGGSSWRGDAVMRISVSNWSTTTEDVERSASAMIRVHRELSS